MLSILHGTHEFWVCPPGGTSATERPLQPNAAGRFPRQAANQQGLRCCIPSSAIAPFWRNGNKPNHPKIIHQNYPNYPTPSIQKSPFSHPNGLQLVPIPGFFETPGFDQPPDQLKGRRCDDARARHTGVGGFQYAGLHQP